MIPDTGTGWTKKQLWMVFAIMAATGVFLYWKTFSSAWTLDDFPVIVNNPDVRSWSGFLTNTYPGRPLRELTFLLDYSIFGMKPTGWHIQQVFWHCLNGFLLFRLVIALRGSRLAAWVGSLFFLVHPIHVEVVANISNRKDSLALAFALLSLLAYIRGIASGRYLRGLSLAALFWAVAMTAKSNVVVAPLTWLGYEMLFLAPERRFLLRNNPGKKMALILAGVLLSAVLGWFRLFGSWDNYVQAMNDVMAKMGHLLTGGEILPYFFMVMKSFVFMLIRLVWPFDLSPEYTFSVPTGWSDPWVLSAIAVLAAYSIFLCLAWRRGPAYFFALAWIGVFWVPVSNLLPLSYFAADRYLYAPAAGLALLLAFLTDDRPVRRRTMAFAVLVVCGFFAFLTWQQTDVWRSQESLWFKAVKVNPDSTTALNNLGGVYLEKGQLQKAENYFLKATRNFNDPMPYYNLGRVYEKMGETKKALRNYRYFLAFKDSGYDGLALKLKRRIYRDYGIALD